VDDTDGKTKGWRNTLIFLIKTIGVIIAAQLSYRAATILVERSITNVTIATKLLDAAKKSSLATSKLLVAAVYLVVAAYNAVFGSATRAAAAMRVFNSAIMSNPLGLAAAAFTTFIGLIYLFTSRTKEAESAQISFNKSLTEANKKASESISELKSRVSTLVNMIKDERIELKYRKKAYEELIKIAPEFNGLLEDECF